MIRKFTLKSYYEQFRLARTRKWIEVAFNACDLPGPDFESEDHPNLVRVYEFDSKPFKGATKYAHNKDRGFSDLKRFDAAYRELDCIIEKRIYICDEWLVTLFGRAPKNIYIRMVK